MREPFSQLRWPRSLPWIVTACALLVLYQLSARLFSEAIALIGPILVPLLVALGLSYLLEPLVGWLEERLKWSRSASSLAAVVVSGLVLLFLLTVLVPPIVAQLVTSAHRVPEALRAAAAALEPYLDTLHERYPAAYDSIAGRITQYLGDPAHLTDPIFNSIAGGLKQAVDLGSNLLNTILIPLFVYYILADLAQFRALLESLVPQRFRRSAVHVYDRIGDVTSTFVRGQLLVASILSVLYVVGFLIVRVPLALSLGILAGFGYLVPYVGTLVAVVLTALVTLLGLPTWLSVVGVPAVYLTIQVLEGFMITPRLLGGRLRLHPIVVIVGLIIGGSQFGILGIVLATPLLAVLKVLLGSLREPYRASDFFTEGGAGAIESERSA